MQLRSRRLAPILALVFALLPLQTAASAELAEDTRVEAASQVDPTSVPARAARSAGDEVSCDVLEERIKAEPSAVPDGMSLCIESAPQVDVAQLLQEDGDVSTLDVIDTPDWCSDHAFDGWWFTRTDACMTRDLQGVFVQNGQFVGGVNFLEYNYSHTRTNSARWEHQIELYRYSSWGTIGTLRAAGASSCDGACVRADLGLLGGQMKLREDVESSSAFVTTATDAAEKEVGFASTTWTYRIFSTVAGASNTVEVKSPATRGDNASPEYRKPGVVFHEYTPDLQYSLERVPDLAGHIKNAQNSGLPGAPGGTPLQRLTDKEKVDQNRNRSCPRRYPRPEGKSCDEYPFASTWEGSSTADPPGDPRTFNGCSIDELKGTIGTTGPLGYSVCMINATENTAGGRALGSFYRTNRMIEKDKFFVKIV